MSDNNGSGPQLTPVEEWTRLRLHGAVKVLESTGRVIRWRPVNLTRMLKEGKIPDHLTGYLAQKLWLGAADDPRSDEEKLIDWQDYVELVVACSLISPRVTENPQGADEVHPDDLLYQELVEIETMARNPVEEVRRFRGEQAANVGAGAKGGKVQQAAK